MDHNHYNENSSINNYYTCPMHPDIKQDKPGKCPKCGGMDLVKINSTGSPRESDINSGSTSVKATTNSQAMHDHASMMTRPEAATDFLRRFFIVTALLVPLAIFSEPA